MLQFPFILPVPQAWQRTQSRMLSHTAWKPWAETEVGPSGDGPREDTTSKRQSWRGNTASSPRCQGKGKKKNYSEHAVNEGFISPGAQHSSSKISYTNSLHWAVIRCSPRVLGGLSKILLSQVSPVPL